MSNFKIAQKFFDNHDYEKAFEILEIISHDECVDSITRANAFNMMGVIVSGFAPQMGNDETGLLFFKRAIELDPANIGALLNIAYGYGRHPSQHNDKQLMEWACKQLIGPLRQRLSEDDIQRIEDKLL